MARRWRIRWRTWTTKSLGAIEETAKRMTLTRGFEPNKGPDAALMTERFFNRIRLITGAVDRVRNLGSNRFGVGPGQLLIPFFRTIANGTGLAFRYAPHTAALETLTNGIEAIIRGKWGDQQVAEFARQRTVQGFVRFLIGASVVQMFEGLLGGEDEEKIRGLLLGPGAERNRNRLAERLGMNQTVEVGGERVNAFAIDPHFTALQEYANVRDSLHTADKKGLLAGLGDYLNRGWEMHIKEPLLRDVAKGLQDGKMVDTYVDQFKRRFTPMGGTRRAFQTVMGGEREGGFVDVLGETQQVREEGTASAVLTALGVRVQDRPPKPKADAMEWMLRTDQAVQEAGGKGYIPTVTRKVTVALKRLGYTDEDLPEIRKEIGRVFWNLIRNRFDFKGVGTEADLKTLEGLRSTATRNATRLLRLRKLRERQGA